MSSLRSSLSDLSGKKNCLAVRTMLFTLSMTRLAPQLDFLWWTPLNTTPVRPFVGLLVLPFLANLYQREKQREPLISLQLKPTSLQRASIYIKLYPSSFFVR